MLNYSTEYKERITLDCRLEAFLEIADSELGIKNSEALRLLPKFWQPFALQENSSDEIRFLTDARLFEYTLIELGMVKEYWQPKMKSKLEGLLRRNGTAVVSFGLNNIPRLKVLLSNANLQSHYHYCSVTGDSSMNNDMSCKSIIFSGIDYDYLDNCKIPASERFESFLYYVLERDSKARPSMTASELIKLFVNRTDQLNRDPLSCNFTELNSIIESLNSSLVSVGGDIFTFMVDAISSVKGDEFTEAVDKFNFLTNDLAIGRFWQSKLFKCGLSQTVPSNFASIECLSELIARSECVASKWDDLRTIFFDFKSGRIDSMNPDQYIKKLREVTDSEMKYLKSILDSKVFLGEESI